MREEVAVTTDTCPETWRCAVLFGEGSWPTPQLAHLSSAFRRLSARREPKPARLMKLGTFPQPCAQCLQGAIGPDRSRPTPCSLNDFWRLDRYFALARDANRRSTYPHVVVQTHWRSSASHDLLRTMGRGGPEASHPSSEPTSARIRSPLFPFPLSPNCRT